MIHCFKMKVKVQRFVLSLLEAQHTKANNKHRYLGLSRHYVGLKLCSKTLKEFRAVNEKLDMKTILLKRLLFLMNWCSAFFHRAFSEKLELQILHWKLRKCFFISWTDAMCFLVVCTFKGFVFFMDWSFVLFSTRVALKRFLSFMNWCHMSV